MPFQTADATPVVAAYYDAAPRPLCAFWIDVKVVALYSDGSKAAAYWLQGLFRSSAAGVLTQVGSTASIITAEEDTGSMDCTMAASGTQIQVTVTGVAATTINWVLDNTIRHAPFSK